MSINFLRGLFPAMVTPFKSDESIDENALGALVERLVKQGADGLYVCGSSGEAILLSLTERKKILETALAAAKGLVPVVAHIGCQRTSDTLELAAHAKQAGAAAVSALPPIYYKYTIEELSAYYRSILNTVDLPLIVYNAPALTGVFFDQNNISGVFDHPNSCGMKFTSYDSYRMQRLMAMHPDKVMINGHDETYLPALALGVRCAIGSTLNFTLGNFRQMLEQFESGDMEGARNGQDAINQIVDILLEVGVFRSLKGVLNLIGVRVGNCRRPFSPLTSREMSLLERILPLLV